MAAAARHCTSWADLQQELLGLVLVQLPSLADRVRLAAVCRPWRHGARLEPVPPPFPWLTLRDCTFLSIPDGKIYCLPSSVPPGDFQCHGSVGNWLFLEQDIYDGSSPPLSMMNPFSKNVMQLPDADTICRHERPVHRQRPRIMLKMVLLSSSMDLSPDSLFAVLITDCSYESVISICQPSTASAFPVPDYEYVRDIALVDGKLYALSAKKLFVLEVETSGKCKPQITSMKCIADDVHKPGTQRKTIAGEEHLCAYWNYLVESGGKLLLVRRLVGCLSVLPAEERRKNSRTFSFDVFEVDLTTSSSVKWKQLNSLGGEALFVGPYSKASQASKSGAQADCIYFMCDYGSRCFADPLRDSGVFNLRNRTITPLLPQTMVMQEPEGVAKMRSADKFYSACPSWFFPC